MTTPASECDDVRRANLSDQKGTDWVAPAWDTHLGRSVPTCSAYAGRHAWEGYVLLRWNARLLVVFLGSDLDGIFLVFYADEAYHLQTDAIAAADTAAEIRRRRDHKRGIRGTARQVG